MLCASSVGLAMLGPSNRNVSVAHRSHSSLKTVSGFAIVSSLWSRGPARPPP